MSVGNYSLWIWNEIKQSWGFTLLNVLGIVINVALVAVFLSLVQGVERTFIERIAQDADLMTIEVRSGSGAGLQANRLSSFYSDPRIVQIVPVITDFAGIRVASNIAFTDAPIQTDTLEGIVPQLSVIDPIESPVVEIYTLNRANIPIDVRTQRLRFLRGSDIMVDDPTGVILSATKFAELAETTSDLTLDNYASFPIEIVATRVVGGIEEFRSFPVSISGISESTPYTGVQAFIAMQLAVEIANWQGGSDPAAPVFDRFELIVPDLDTLRAVRTDLLNIGLATESILDTIEGVQDLLLQIRVVSLSVLSAAVLIAGFNLFITLWSYVLKRYKEIGILKSVGATDQQVQNIFILHSIYLSLVGGIIGVGVAILTMTLLQQFVVARSQNPLLAPIFVLDLQYVIIVVVAALVLGAFSAFLPARRAAQITPVETMRN